MRRAAAKPVPAVTCRTPRARNRELDEPKMNGTLRPGSGAVAHSRRHRHRVPWGPEPRRRNMTLTPKSFIFAILALVMTSSFATQAQAGHGNNSIRGAISVCDDPICIVFGNIGYSAPRHVHRHVRPHRWGHRHRPYRWGHRHRSRYFGHGRGGYRPGHWRGRNSHRDHGVRTRGRHGGNNAHDGRRHRRSDARVRDTRGHRRVSSAPSRHQTRVDRRHTRVERHRRRSRVSTWREPPLDLTR